MTATPFTAIRIDGQMYLREQNPFYRCIGRRHSCNCQCHEWYDFAGAHPPIIALFECEEGQQFFEGVDVEKIDQWQSVYGSWGEIESNWNINDYEINNFKTRPAFQLIKKQHPTPNVPLIADVEKAAEIATTDRFKHSCVALSGQLLYKEGYMTALHYERSKLPQIIKEVLKRAADQMTFIYHDGFNKTDNRVIHAQFGIDHVRIDKQSILNINCDDLIK